MTANHSGASRAQERQSTNAPRRLYPVDETSHQIGISEASTWKLIGEGKLGSVRVGHRRLVPTEAIEAFVAERIAEAAAS